MEKTKKQLQEELDELRYRQKQDLEYINRFIHLIKINGFDRKFLQVLFESNARLDYNRASREIINFILLNKRNWEKIA